MLSIILPAKDEAESLKVLLPSLIEEYQDAEIIIVNDASVDNTEQVCRDLPVRLINHLYSKGNGAAVKTGASAASGNILVFMDADGQHVPSDIQYLLKEIHAGYDMAVGMRKSSGQASIYRNLANSFYNKFASLITGHNIGDLTSGFRAARKSLFCRYLYLLPNGFSYPSTITMAFFRAGYSVAYVPISVQPRTGRSHLRPFRDGLRFLLIIFKIGTLYSPLKIFAPTSLLFLILGFVHYAYVYITQDRFTNMSAMLFITALLVFLIGLISEQITTLLYSQDNRQDSEEAD